jgi:tetratricopeptide (TPR) repeat protein
MKRTLTLWLAVLGLAIAPLAAQTAQPTGKIHGTVTNPVGTPQPNGTVSLSTGPGEDKFTFQVTNGTYSGEAAPGTYAAIFRNPDTPKDKQVDSFQNIKIVAGQDILQDFDMSREAYIKTLPADTQKQLEDLKKKNAAALGANAVIKQINGDLAAVTQDIKDADAAGATAQQQLGASAAKTDVAAKATEIKTAKYTDAETLMAKDSAAKPDASILWARLGQAQAGLKKWDDAESSFKKAIDIEAKNPKPNIEVQGLAQSGLGEVYARNGKVDDAAKAYDAAAAANPKSAAVYYKNQTVIYFQIGNPTAQSAAADKAITADPSNALLYYLKGQALVGNATVDPKTQKIVLPPGCAEAYQKYLELAPTGPYAADAKGILDSAGQKINNTFKAGKKS